MIDPDIVGNNTYLGGVIVMGLSGKALDNIEGLVEAFERQKFYKKGSQS